MRLLPATLAYDSTFRKTVKASTEVQYLFDILEDIIANHPTPPSSTSWSDIRERWIQAAAIGEATVALAQLNSQNKRVTGSYAAVPWQTIAETARELRASPTSMANTKARFVQLKGLARRIVAARSKEWATPGELRST